MAVARKGKMPKKEKPKAKMKKAGRKPANAAILPLVGGMLGTMGVATAEAVTHRYLSKRQTPKGGRKMTKKEEAAGKKLVAGNIAKRRKKDILRHSSPQSTVVVQGGKAVTRPKLKMNKTAKKIFKNLRKSRKDMK